MKRLAIAVLLALPMITIQHPVSAAVSELTV
jgi:hypothetical protein